MKKQRLDIEYPLTTKSEHIVWEQISSPHGLERWIADHVNDEGNGRYAFTWGEPWTQQHTLTANIVKKNENSLIRFRWTEEEDEGAYWEMRIERSELTGLLNLLITDYAWAEDLDDLRGLWDGNLERLHNYSGL